MCVPEGFMPGLHCTLCHLQYHLQYLACIQSLARTTTPLCTLSLIKNSWHTLTPLKLGTACSSTLPDMPSTVPGPYSRETPRPSSFKSHFWYLSNVTNMSYQLLCELPSRCNGVEQLEMMEMPLKMDTHQLSTSWSTLGVSLRHLAVCQPAS